ncbi:MAG: heavy metal translocating P-type ATPase, partial [Gemmatimonadales bacterium]
LAAYLVYFALAAAMLTFGLTLNIRSTISVIIVAGACGIAAGTPLAILGAIGRCASIGALVRGGVYLEALSTVDTVVLDKTGTLTTGRPEVIGVVSRNGASDHDVLAYAAAAESRSEHPIAGAIVRAAEERGLVVVQPERFAYTPGLGVDASVGGSRVLVGSARLMHQNGVFDPAVRSAGATHGIEVFVVRGGRVLGTIVMADRLRSEASRAVLSLRAMGIRTVLLSGDDRLVADAIGKEAGVDEVVANALPEAKQTYVRELVAAGRRVAMVGDGINDAPAIVEATVGVAMGSGTDVARESAGVVLLRNDLMPLVQAIRTARRARATIWTNFAGTIGVDLVGMGLAAAGLLNPLLAAFIHVASELAFILNSARLIPRTRLLVALLCLMAGASAGAQSGYRNTESGRPLRIEDAEAIELNGLELQFAPFRLERPRPGIERWQLEPRLGYGILPRTELVLRAPIVYREPGTYPRGGLAGIGVGALRNFNDETPALPSFALSGEVVIPAGGAATKSATWAIRGAATRTFTPGRLHFNAAYGTYNLIVYPTQPAAPGCTQTCGGIPFPFNDGPCEVDPAAGPIVEAPAFAPLRQFVLTPPQGLPTVRQGRRLLLGMAGDHSFPLWSTLLAADLFVERFSLSTQPADWTVELGARHQVTARVIVDAGLGRRFTGAAPAWFATFGTSYAFVADPLGLHGNCP